MFRHNATALPAIRRVEAKVNESCPVVSDTAVAVIARAPNRAIPQLRLTLATKLSVDSSNLSANMLKIMPSSAKDRLNTPLSAGSTPIFTSTLPTKRKYSTGVNRVIFASTTAAKTAAQMMPRCAGGSITEAPVGLKLAKLTTLCSNPNYGRIL